MRDGAPPFWCETLGRNRNIEMEKVIITTKEEADAGSHMSRDEEDQYKIRYKVRGL